MRGQLTQRCAAALTAGLGVLALAAAGGAPAVAQEGCSDVKPRAADPGVTPVASGYQFVGTGDPRLPIRLSNEDGTKWCPSTSFIFSRAPSWVLPNSQGSWAPELKNDIVVAPALKKDIVVYSAVPRRPYAVEQNEKRKKGDKHEPLPRCIGVAIRDPGTTVFEDLRPVCSPSKKGRFIDPTIFANDGETYLLYKEDPRLPKKPRPGHLVRKAIVIRKITINAGTANPPAPAPAPTLKLGPRRVTLRAKVDKRGRAKVDKRGKPISWEGVSVEAPTMIRRGGKYYLFYSGGNFTTRNYGVGVAMSGRPDGGFKRLGRRPIIGGKHDPVANRCGVGHQDVTPGPGGVGWRIYFHASDMVRDKVEGKPEGRLRCRVSKQGSHPRQRRYLVVRPSSGSGGSRDRARMSWLRRRHPHLLRLSLPRPHRPRPHRRPCPHRRPLRLPPDLLRGTSA
jgi:hypothetical protein